MSARKTRQVNARLTPDELAQVDHVAAIEPAVRGRSEGIRRLIRASMQPGGSVPVEATVDPAVDEVSGREARIPGGVSDARALREAVLQARDDFVARIAGLESQVRAHGHLLNQIARACNDAARRGVSTGFDEHQTAALRDEQERLALAAVEMGAEVAAAMADLDRKTRR